MRLGARSLIAPSSGERTKTIPIEIATIVPYTLSARSGGSMERR
jgi:hypothetical protein